MEIKYEKKMVYRVWYGSDVRKEAFFTLKEDAEAFAKMVDGIINYYKWEIMIEL